MSRDYAICWNRSCCDNIKVPQVLKMQSYYSRQAVMPHFSRHTRQRGSGLESLAAGVGRVALPFPNKVLLPAVKSMGKEFFVQSLPELMDVATKKISQKSSEISCEKNSEKSNWRKCINQEE